MAGEQAEWPVVGLTLRVDGQGYPLPQVWIGESLLSVLRERLGFDEPRDGCSLGECGACVVELDGLPAAACLVPAVAAVDRDVRTPRDGSFAAAKAALAEVGADPCGHCGPGLAVAITILLRRNPDPGPAAVREALAGHLCPCADAGRWVEAVASLKAAERAAAGGTGQHDRPANLSGTGQHDRPANLSGTGQHDRPADFSGTGQHDRPADFSGTGQHDRPGFGPGAAR